MRYANYGERARARANRERLDKYYKQALQHYYTVCFYRPPLDTTSNWETRAVKMAKRYMRLWYGLA